MSTTDKPQHKVVIEHNFNSMTELVNYITDTDSLLPEPQRTSKNKSPDRTAWSGTDSMETALELAKFGWGDGLKKIRKLAAEVKVHFPDLFAKQEASEEITHSMVGNYEDPSLDDSPDPENMLKFKPKFDELKYGSVLQRLIIESSSSGGITPETFFLRGACIVALVEQLETYGFRLEIILQDTTANGMWGNEKGQELAVIRTKLKSFEDHLDIDTLAFAVANPSFARRLMFGVMETFPLEQLDNFRVGATYGAPHNHPMYIDPARDFYMVRPLDNEDFATVIAKTVDLINKRYKGMVEDDYNPKLDEGSGFGGQAYPLN